MADKAAGAFQTITEVSFTLDLPAHVLRFWETKFMQLKPMKRSGGRRYYRPEDIEILQSIKALLYEEGFTIKGAQKALSLRKSSPAKVLEARGDAIADDATPANNMAQALALLDDADKRLDRLLLAAS
jgi:DNA-binding transcriptional MerR regulator